MSVRQIAELTGITPRTLRYYDEIGLLKPGKVTEAGYRLYDEAALGRLQMILLFRELRFPLKEIRRILDNPDFDLNEGIAQQIRLLEMQYRHLGELIAFSREILSKGVTTMNFEVFDKSEMEAYEAEVKARWGDTEAYKTFCRRRSARSQAQSGRLAQELMAIFCAFGRLKEQPPQADAVQAKVAALQGFITDHYYTCTDEILGGLGKLYTEDARFRKNIDRAGGEGTADFVGRVIAAYCAKKRAS